MSDFVEDGLREHQATNDVMLGLLSASQRQQNLKQQHAQTQELQPHMKPLPLLALTLGFILCTMGCSTDRKVLAVKQPAEAKVTAEAKARAVKQPAEAKVTAEAKALAEKRLEWTGKAMQRAGMKEETVKRTLTQGGTVVAWGDNGNGQTTVPAGLSGVVAIAAGENYTVALKQDGTVVAWGGNAKVPAGLSGVVAIAGGGLHTVALKQDGTVVAWGHNGYGQTTVPAGLSGVVAIAAGGGHTVALKQDGQNDALASQSAMTKLL